MAAMKILIVLVAAISFANVEAKIGYFWHITDLHYNHLYSPHGDIRHNCWRTDTRGNTGYHRAPGEFGDPACDSPWTLIESASQHMRTRHGDNVEFVLWTGDAVTSNADLTPSERLSMLRNVTDLLSRTFSSQFVFPALGHEDPLPSPTLNHMWMHWLPTEALLTFETGGYYTIEQSHSKLRILVLNTNLFLGGKGRQPLHALALQQWNWFEKVLAKAVQKNEMVYIVGHVAPGADERGGGSLPHSHAAYAPEHNERYLRLLRRYAHVVAGQFFGHLHSDTFRILYSEKGKPISWMMLAPSVTPRRMVDGSNNPGLRLYKFDSDKGQVLDYIQYYLDLENANKIQEAEWTVEYNLTHYYRLAEISAASLHDLASKFTYANPNDNNAFNRYIRANSVRMTASCDRSCAHTHFCAISRLDYADFWSCVDNAASRALAANSASSLDRGPINCLFTIMFALVMVIYAAYPTFPVEYVSKDHGCVMFDKCLRVS